MIWGEDDPAPPKDMSRKEWRGFLERYTTEKQAYVAADRARDRAEDERFMRKRGK